MMKLSRVFSPLGLHKTASVMGAALVAASALGTAPASAAYMPQTESTASETRSDWKTLNGSGEDKAAIGAARDLLKSVFPSFETVFAETSPVILNGYSEPGQAETIIGGGFIMTPSDERLIYLVENDSDGKEFYGLIRASFMGDGADEKTLPTYEEFKTMDIVATIANEAAHYWQSKENAAFMKKATSDSVECNDTIAIEQSSDYFMTSIAASLYVHLSEKDTPESTRQKTALEWTMIRTGLFDLPSLAETPAENIAEFSLFMREREATYRTRNDCPLHPVKDISAEAKTVSAAPLRQLMRPN